MKKKILRSGYTTGACAAAAAKAATMILLQRTEDRRQITEHRTQTTDIQSLTSGFCLLASSVEIPFPDGSRHRFVIHDSGYRAENGTAWATVIKDAGDDPDVTNGAEIRAEVRSQMTDDRAQTTDNKSLTSDFWLLSSVLLRGGKGVGVVTKPGLPVPMGEPAINPIPRKMITEAVREALIQMTDDRGQKTEIRDQSSDIQSLASDFWLLSSVIEVTISVPLGEELALKTLNPRLGIAGGISILGTTGIVRPVSAEAWMATITSSMDVARALGHEEVVLSAGRASETAHMEKHRLPEESYVMMGDYLEFSLREAVQHGFRKIHIAAQWAKMVKISLETPQTHVRHGALDVTKAVEFISSIWPSPALNARHFNTAREVFDLIVAEQGIQAQAFRDVCKAAKKYAEEITGGIPVITHLVSYEGRIITDSE
ncbi:MAG: cobalt-precorrin-5B (C(1))-methyltransferase CbiD [Thermodesulfovibrionales bacterium]